MRVVQKDKGHISGIVIGEPGNKVAVFRGIPYAAPPVGEFRWKLPQPAEPWLGFKECVVFTPAPQGTLIPPRGPAPGRYAKRIPIDIST